MYYAVYYHNRSRWPFEQVRVGMSRTLTGKCDAPKPQLTLPVESFCSKSRRPRLMQRRSSHHSGTETRDRSVVAALPLPALFTANLEPSGPNLRSQPSGAGELELPRSTLSILWLRGPESMLVASSIQIDDCRLSGTQADQAT